MSRLCIDAELLTVAAAMWLRLSGQNGMPDDSQSEKCIKKTMKAYRKINILSTNRFWGFKNPWKFPDFEGDNVVEMQNRCQKWTLHEKLTQI